MTELEDKIEEWFRQPPALAVRHPGRSLAIGVTVAGLLAGAGAAYELRRSTPSPSPPRHTIQPLLRLDPLYVSAPREPRELISAQK